MTQRNTLVLVGLGLVIGAWVWISVHLAQPAAPESPVAEREAAAADAVRTDRDEAARERPLSRTEVAVAPEGEDARITTGSLVVRAVWSDGSPAQEVGVDVQHRRRGFPSRILARAVTDPEGIARIERLPAGELEVWSDRGAGEKAIVRAGQEQEVRLQIGPGIAVEGIVRDGAGRPVADAGIWLTSHLSGWSGGRVVARSDPTGGFRLRGVPQEQSLGALAPGFAPSELVDLEEIDTSDPPVHVELVVTAPGGSVHGRVLDPAGRGIAGARVAVGDPRYHHSFRRDGGRREGWSPRTATTGEDGWYALDALAPGTHPVEVRADGYPSWHGRCEVVAGQQDRRDVRLEEGVTVHGVVRDERHAPLPGAVVRAFPEPITETYLQLGQYDNESVSDYPHAIADEEGRYRVDLATPGRLHLYASPEGWGQDLPWDHAVLEAAPGASLEWNAVIEPGLTIEGLVLYRDGNPMGSKFVIAVAQGKDRRSVEDRIVTRSDEEGRFRFVCLENQPYDVDIQLLRAPKDQPPLQRKGVWPGRDLVRFVAGYDSPREHEPGTVSGRVVDAGERLQGGRFGVVLDRGSSWRHGAEIDGDGFRFERVPPGRYRVELLSGEDTVHVGPWFELHAGEAKDIGVVMTEPAGVLLVQIDREPGTEDTEATVTLSHEAGAGRSAKVGSANRVRIENLMAGEHRIRAYGEGAAAESRVCRVVAGAETQVTIRLLPAVRRDLVIDYPEGQRLTSVVVANEEGVRFRDTDLVRPVPRPYETWTRLPVGRYVLRAETHAGVVDQVSFVVESLDERGDPVKLELR